MQHFECKLENTNLHQFNKCVQFAMETIIQANDPCEFKVLRIDNPKQLQKHQGKFTQYGIYQNENIIGYLESFVEQNFKYVEIYTTPI
ncbi:MAG: hypothetical protein RLZZ357_508 [Bacteroidota bacterium]|jgi:hypothetical protein